MSLFLIAGSFRHGVRSRLNNMIRSEGGLHWIRILLGVLLVSNASVPPIPSFFSELLILITVLVKRGYLILRFLGVSLVVCYYNAFIFLCVSHIKSIRPISTKTECLTGSLLIIFFFLKVKVFVWFKWFFFFSKRPTTPFF